MVLSIKDPEADRLAREIAALTGESITQVVVNALRDRLAREPRKTAEVERRVADALEIGRHYVAQPVQDRRTPEQIIGYDEL